MYAICAKRFWQEIETEAAYVADIQQTKQTSLALRILQNNFPYAVHLKRIKRKMVSTGLSLSILLCSARGDGEQLVHTILDSLQTAGVELSVPFVQLIPSKLPLTV